MEFRILGPLEVCGEAGRLELPPGRPRALLALLLLHANETLSTDRIADALWRGHPPPTAAKIVQGYVRALRQALGRERIITAGGGYELVVGEECLDAWKVESARRRARTQQPAEAVLTLRGALAEFRGEPLQELGDSGETRGEVMRLEELRLACIEDVVEMELAAGLHADVVGTLESLIDATPYRERFREQLMVALYRGGRQAEALEAYHDAHRALRELGLEPSRRVRELEQAILRQDPALDVPSAAHPRTHPAMLIEGRPQPGESVFVGRSAELAALVERLESAIAGSGRLVLLAGEPGIGKSRLADELLALAHVAGAQTLVGRCWEAGGAPAYWPWVHALHGVVRDAVADRELRLQLGDGAADLAQILPDLRESLPGLPALLPVEPDVGRFRLFQAVTAFLGQRAARTPLVLFLDDLHAADTSSLLLLQFVVREIATARMLIVGAYRDVDPVPTHEFRALLGDLLREPSASQIALRGLGASDIRQYVDRTEPRVASDRLVTTLRDRTDGNPLFVAEILRLITLEEKAGNPRPLHLEEVPQTVQAVMTRRFRHLPNTTKELLSVASVLGREFQIAVLAQLSGLEVDEVLDVLEQATAARVVGDVPGAPSALRFAHVLMRDTLYQQLTATRRIRLHREVVRALQEVHAADLGPHLGEIAQHALAAADPGAALTFATRAADRARVVLAYDEAARLYLIALEALDLVAVADDELRCELLLALAETASAGDRDAAKDACLQAAALARRLGLPYHLARAAAGYGGRTPWSRAGQDAVLVPLLEEALASLPNDEVELRARLLARLAGALRDEFSRERRTALSGQALELARRAGSPAGLAYALDGRAASIFAPDTVHECLKLATELRDVANAIGDKERTIAAHWNMFMAHVLLGEMNAARADFAAAAALTDELRQPVEEHNVEGARAMLALAAGKLEDARASIDKAYAIGLRAQPDMAEPNYVVQQYTLFDLQGRPGEAAEAVAKLAHDYPARPVFTCVLAHLHARIGRSRQAAETLEQLCANECGPIPFDQEWLYALTLLAEAAWVVEHQEAAATIYPLLLPWSELTAVDHVEGYGGAASRYLGLLASTLERWDEAEAHFTDALARNVRIGALPWAAHAQRDHADTLRKRRRNDPRAAQLLARASRTYRSLRMPNPPAAD